MTFWEDLTAVTAACVHFTEAPPEGAPPDGLRAYEVAPGAPSGEANADHDDLLARLGVSLGLSPSFGRNWDALTDALRDLEGPPDVLAHVLVVSGAERLWRRAPALAGALVETWLFAAEEARGRGLALHLVFVW